MQECSLQTEIRTLGPCKLDSVLPYRTWADNKSVQIVVDEELSEEVNAPFSVCLEAAGPRKKLYFDTTRAKCAIVTCGGLCPGINDVIRAIVMEAFHAYNVPSILGIAYGLEGFIPKYGHAPFELTPSSVADIHRFGGTMLGSSRGPQSAEEIVDTLERSNVNALFVIGGDGTMKAALAISSEVQARGLKISVIGIPKTIDNDINFIPQSFGFETAAFKATEAIECAHTEACGVPNGIGLVKLMGRESGFIAARAALALKEVNFVLIPEAPFALEGEGGLLPALEERLRSRGHAVIVAAEGAGQHLMENHAAKDVSGNPVLGDVSDLLRKNISSYLGARGIEHARFAPHQGTTRKHQSGHGLQTAGGNAIGSVSNPPPTLQTGADARMRLETLEFLERRKVWVGITQSDDKTDRHPTVFQVIQETAAVGIRR